MRHSTKRQTAALCATLAIAVAACGGSSSGSDTGNATASATATGGSATDDTAMSATSATDSGSSTADSMTATESSTAASGTAGTASGDGSADLGPIKVGVINSNDLFGEYSGAIEAAAEYINKELGGLDGREIELQVCSIDYGSPDDTQRCANELSANEVEFAITTLNQFGNQFEILRGAGIPVLVGTAVAVPDYTTPDTYAISPGGGCPGTLTAMAKYAAEELGARNLAVPYYDIPSGALCYYDNEAKGLQVLQGEVTGSSSEAAGTMPDLKFEGIASPPGGDQNPIATQILALKPDAILFSGPATDCWPLVDALGALGWTPDSIPFVMSTSCFDSQSIAAAGDLGNGIYFVGNSGHLIADPATLSDPDQKAEAELYQGKVVEYGLAEDLVTRNFAQQGFTLIMSMKQRSETIASGGEQVTGATLSAAFASTDNSPQFGSGPISCSKAPAPYITLCNTDVDVTQWDGSALTDVIKGYNAMDLIAGTEIITPPS